MLAAATKLRILFITYPVRLSNVLRILRSALWRMLESLSLGTCGLDIQSSSLGLHGKALGLIFEKLCGKYVSFA